MDTLAFFYDTNKPKQPVKSYGKLAVQQRMRLAMAFMNPLRPIIAETWLHYGKGSRKKAFGQALKKLMQDALEGEYPDQHVIPSRVAISMGILPPVQIEEVLLNKRELEICFSSGESPMAKASDEVVLVAYSPEAGVAGRNTEVCIRAQGHLTVELPPPLWDVPFHAYLFVHSANKRQYSKSQYIGLLTCAE
jgi:hypothetical protein